MTKPTPTGRIGKYEVIELLGEGAMGNVYLAADPVLNRSVAIKVMNSSIARDAEQRDRFMREAQAAGSLQHPNVVTIFDFGEQDGHPFIAMEFVAGVDLEDVLHKKLPLTLDQILAIAIDVALGLSYAHKRGIVHRDIKPANIRLTDEWRAKIMDFGIAHLESNKMTRTGMLMGTPNYMAPEQVTGGKITAASDLFSLGTVLYEMLTGANPFAADTLHNALFKVVSQDPPPLTTAAPDLPAGLTPILQRALAKDSEHRYQGAIELANDLTAIRASLTGGRQHETLSLSATLSHRVQPANATPPPTKRPPWALIGGGAAAVVTVAALLTRGPAQSAPTSAPLAAPSPGDPAAAPPVTPPAQPAPAAQAASPGEAGVVAVLRQATVAERAGALSRGARRASLAEGDALLARADVMISKGQIATAVPLLTAAARSWRDAAESSALPVLAGTVPAAQAPPAAAPAETGATRPAPAVTDPPATVTRTEEPRAAPPQAETAPAASPAPQPRDDARAIASVIAAWQQALETRDVSRLRAVFPELPSQQAARFAEFFRAVRSLQATLVPATPQVNGTAATTTVTGTYAFTDERGEPRRQPVTFVATLHHDEAGWHIRSIQ